MELAQILIHTLGLHGGAYDAIANFDVIGKAGYVIVGAFVVAWAGPSRSIRSAGSTNAGRR